MLFDLRLGTTRSDIGPDTHWVGMHPRLANVYMAALAETMAQRRVLSPVARDTVNHFAVSGLTFERLAQVLLEDAQIAPSSPTEDELETVLASIAIQAVMPKDLDKVSVDQILHIREDYGGDRIRFQTFVQDVIARCPELEHITVPEFVNEHLKVEYDRQIKPQMEALQDAMRSNGVDTVSTVLNMDLTKVPALLTSVGTIAGSAVVNPILGAATVVALGLLKIVGDKRKKHEGALKASDVSYLMHIKEDLTPIASLKWFETHARKLVLGF